jgi:hypothetical protein
MAELLTYDFKFEGSNPAATGNWKKLRLKKLVNPLGIVHTDDHTL